MKIVLAGSPEFVLPTFEEIIKHFNVVGLITNEDKPKGRGMKVMPTSVALLGEKYNIPVFKTNNVSELYPQLKALEYDLLLTFAFGQYIPETILDLGIYRPLNIHGSILPKYRGASPVQYAILNGDKEIGISLIEMTKQMDTGKIYFISKIKIHQNTTGGQAFEIIANLALKNITNWLNKVKINAVKPYSQGQNFTLSPKISKSMAELTNDLTCELALRKIRAFNPIPGAFVFYQYKGSNQRLKIFDATTEPTKNAFKLEFKNGNLWITEFQFENKQRQKV